MAIHEIPNQALCKYKGDANSPEKIPNYKNSKGLLLSRENANLTSHLWVGFPFILPQSLINATKFKIKIHLYTGNDTNRQDRFSVNQKTQHGIQTKQRIGAYFSNTKYGEYNSFAKANRSSELIENKTEPYIIELQKHNMNSDAETFGIVLMDQSTYDGTIVAPKITIEKIQFCIEDQIIEEFDFCDYDLNSSPFKSSPNEQDIATIVYKDEEQAEQNKLKLSKGDIYSVNNKYIIWNGLEWRILENNIDLNKYQLKYDNEFNTTNKNVVGAVNELNNTVQIHNPIIESLIENETVPGFYNSKGLKYTWADAKNHHPKAFREENGQTYVQGYYLGEDEGAYSYFANDSLNRYDDVYKIIFPTNITKVDYYAFYQMPSLRHVILTNVDQINSYAFATIDSLINIELSSQTRFIDRYAFTNLGMSPIVTSLTIPKSLFTFGENCFRNYVIQKIYYEGSKEEWNNIGGLNFNPNLKQTNIYYNQALATREFVLANAIQGVITEQLLTEAPLEIVDELDENADKTGKKLLRAALDYEHSFELNEYGVLQLRLGEGLGRNENGICVSEGYIKELLGDTALIRDIYPDRAILENDEPPYEIYPSNVIYMIPSESEDGTYDEYMNVNNKWEQIGSTAINLSNYQTKTDNDLQTNNKNLVGAINELKGLIDSYWETINEVLEDVY